MTRKELEELFDKPLEYIIEKDVENLVDALIRNGTLRLKVLHGEPHYFIPTEENPNGEETCDCEITWH